MRRELKGGEVSPGGSAVTPRESHEERIERYWSSADGYQFSAENLMRRELKVHEDLISPCNALEFVGIS